MEALTPEVKYEKPICPKCGRGNVRCRTTPEFEDVPFRCNICGHVWKPGK